MPYCGVEAEETELTAGGEAHLKRFGQVHLMMSLKITYLCEKRKRVNFERWHHTYGCGKWFHAARCSITLEVFGTYLAQTLEPPKELLSTILRKRPEWESF